MPEYNVTCLEDGSWDEPAEWPVCFNCEFRIYSFGSKHNFTAVNCTHPPEKAAAGTWEWNGNLNYGTEVLYTCGPYGNFLDAEGFLYEELISTCRLYLSCRFSSVIIESHFIERQKLTKHLDI